MKAEGRKVKETKKTELPRKKRERKRTKWRNKGTGTTCHCPPQGEQEITEWQLQPVIDPQYPLVDLEAYEVLVQGPTNHQQIQQTVNKSNKPPTYPTNRQQIQQTANKSNKLPRNPTMSTNPSVSNDVNDTVNEP